MQDDGATALWIISGIGLLGEVAGIAYAVGSKVVFLKSKIDGSHMDPAKLDRARRRGAKRFNEHLKLFAAFLNGVGIAFLITVAITPLAQGQNTPISGLRSLLALGVALVLHLIGQGVLALWKSED
jgi:zinc transporter ZupT